MVNFVLVIVRVGEMLGIVGESGLGKIMFVFVIMWFIGLEGLICF